MYTIGWFSTGRDKAARDLLKTVHRAIKKGEIPDAKILYVFCNREEGESNESDKFIELAEQKLGICTIPFSSSRFKRLENESLEDWRKEYHRVVSKLINFPYYQKVDVIMLAGYMLIVSPELCQKYPMINLHPALPSGPKGTWQEVIWQLIENKERESGVMIHLVTPELDAGPPITFCKFSLRGVYFDDLWRFLDLTKSYREFHEMHRKNLFNAIREHGLKREFPLIVETLKLLALGQIKIGESEALDLTEVVNKKISR